ncbi:MAG: CBS domain-containing protein [Acetobacteraceae bacterium]|jgi:CBS domain-containing protein
MRAIDVMTPNVITVDPDTLVQDLAKLLSERNISGAPVVDKTGGIVGIVSEGDLLHRSELGTERHTQKRRAWWLEHFASELARDYVKSHGRTVKDIMTRDVATVGEDTELAEIATLLETKRIKRVPVLRDGKIVGIVSRANLVRALAAATTEAPMPDADDRAIRARLLTELEKQPWATKLWAQDVIVNNGVVHLWFGSDEPEERRQAARVAAENVPGVRSVDEHEVPIPLMPAF